MSQRLRLNVNDATQEIADRGPGARIEIQRDTSSTFGAPTALGPVALVAGQDQYTYFDPTGSSSNYYRFRLTDNVGSPASASAWSATFRGDADAAYATLEDLREYVDLPDDSKDNLLSDLLVQASAYLDAACERDFYRHPQIDGTETRLFDGTGTVRLRVRAGIVSLSQVEIATTVAGGFTTVDPTDYVLAPTDKAADMSYTSVLLVNYTGSWTNWYTVRQGVRLTGVFGWAEVPQTIRKATLDLAREWYRQGPGGGGPVGVNQFGTPLFLAGMPRSVQDAITRYSAKAVLH
jgi:hypothetical protein